MLVQALRNRQRAALRSLYSWPSTSPHWTVAVEVGGRKGYRAALRGCRTVPRGCSTVLSGRSTCSSLISPRLWSRKSLLLPGGSCYAIRTVG